MMTLRLVILGLALIFAGCSKEPLSERDAKLNQYKNAAETKRKELREIAGYYEGTLTQTSGTNRVALQLEIKDIPSFVEGAVDPVLVPTLTGFLKWFAGSESEFVVFALTKAEFTLRDRKLDFVATNEIYKDILVTGVSQSDKLTGTWSLPAFSGSGTLDFTRLPSVPTP